MNKALEKDDFDIIKNNVVLSQFMPLHEFFKHTNKYFKNNKSEFNDKYTIKQITYEPYQFIKYKKIEESFNSEILLEYFNLCGSNNKITKDTYETVQALWLRVAIIIHLKSDVDLQFKLNKIKETYTHLASGLFIHATPTLFNSGTRIQQLSSCYLLGVDDNLESIFKNYTDCAQISKWAGGIGIHVSNIRARGQMIKTTNGASAGVIPMLQVLNSVCRYIDQGGKRRGSIAIYMEPWHGDILEFLELRKNGGNESDKCRDLFLALWICDKFMEAVLNNNKWYLMSEDQCPGLSDVYGDEFNKLYQSYVCV